MNIYFLTWIGRIRPTPRRPMFEIKLWNCFELTREGKAKTTNSLEAWHNSLKLMMGRQDGKKPPFWKWFRQLKMECSLKEAQLTSLLCGIHIKLKKSDEQLNIRRKTMALNFY